MTPEYAIDILKNLMILAGTIAAPVLLTGMAIGLCISVFQTVTSIQEQTLTFVPKTIGVCAILILLLPWMVRSLIEFTIILFQQMPQMVN